MNACTHSLGNIITAAAVGLLCLGATGMAKPTVTCRVELDREVLYADQEQKAVVKITLDALKPSVPRERPAINLAVVLDRSGSMSGRKIEQAKEAAIHALRRLDKRDMFSLVVYDSGVQTIVPAQRASNTAWIESRIRAIKSGGSTALFGGVSQGASEIRKNLSGNYIHRIILLSDGRANVGPKSPSDLGRLGAGLIKENISVTTVGVGTNYNEDLMTLLAQKSDGNTYFVEESQDLAQIFNEELGDVLSVVAKKVNLIIECRDGVRPIRIIGREGRIRGNSVELAFNQLYGGQGKHALVEVSVPAGKDGETREVAHARVSWDNAVTSKQESARAVGRGRYSRSKAEVDGSVNIEVKRASTIVFNAQAQEDAIKHADAGRVAEAADILEKSADEMKKLANELQDKELRRKAEWQEAEADRIRKEGMSDRSRKNFRTDSNNDIQQQRVKIRYR